MEFRIGQGRGWLTAPAVALVSATILVTVINFWCQLHGSVTGEAPVAFGISLPWALKSALGWVLVGLLLWIYGARLRATPFAQRRPWTTRTALVTATLVVTLTCESLLIRGDHSLPLWLYERSPMHLLFACLLLGGHSWLTRGQARPAAVVDAPADTRGLVEVMTGTGRTQVRIADIECLVAERNYINVHTPQRSYLLRQTLSSLEKSLEAQDFLRVHRSIIVNRAKIRERRQGRVLVLDSGRVVRVSRAFAQELNGRVN